MLVSGDRAPPLLGAQKARGRNRITGNLSVRSRPLAPAQHHPRIAIAGDIPPGSRKSSGRQIDYTEAGAASTARGTRVGVSRNDASQGGSRRGGAGLWACPLNEDQLAASFDRVAGAGLPDVYPCMDEAVFLVVPGAFAILYAAGWVAISLPKGARPRWAQGSSPAHRPSAQPPSPKPDQDDPGYCASRADRKVHELRMTPRSPILANFEQSCVAPK